MNGKATGIILVAAVAAALAAIAADEKPVAELAPVLVEGSALSKYRPETVHGGTFTGTPPELLPVAVDTLTGDFIRERNPTDMNDLLRWVPGIATGGTSLLVRQPGLFTVRGMSGTEPAFDGVIPVGRGAGLFMDPYMMERVEVVKGPVASLSGGAGAQQNNNGAGGSINLYLKGAHLRGSGREFSASTSVGNRTWRQRGMVDANEVLAEDRFALRLPVSFDVYSPAYANQGSQDGARPREQYTLAPSFVAQPRDGLSLGLKTMLISSDSPSYVGIPVWRGEPAGGYGWRESSCRRDDRSVYRGLMVNPYADWQVNDDWLLKFGGAFMYSHLEQTTREPYYGTGAELANYFATGQWSSGGKYQTTSFSESRSFSRNFNLYARSVYRSANLPQSLRNTLMVQPDFYYRDSSGGFGTPTSRYGVTLQDELGWKWISLLAGVRCDLFREECATVDSQNGLGHLVRTYYPSATAHAVSPRGGLTVQPLDWLVFFGNLSQTRTPTLGYVATDGNRPVDPWTATQVEAGGRIRPLEKLWLSASYYRIDQKNMPQADTTAGVTTYYFDGHNSSDGVEVSLSGELTPDWSALLMYAYNFYVDHQATGYGSEFERNPRHVLTFNTSCRLHGMDLLEDVVVGMGYRYRSLSYATMRGKFVDENLWIGSSHVFDVNVSVPLSKFGAEADEWFLTFGVRNLFGERYFETSRHFYECFAGEGRTFEFGVRGRF